MDYFYEHESELFTFYRVPKVLFTEEPFKNMNCEVKLLYGLLLDKMGLSRKSGWFDKQGRAFVYYGISHIMEDLEWPLVFVHISFGYLIYYKAFHDQSPPFWVSAARTNAWVHAFCG